MQKNLIFFDTETTGNQKDDYLCQLAYLSKEEKFNELFLPPKKIPPEASAVHHITNKMVADKPAFQKSSSYPRIKELFEKEDNVLVAHNALFDLEMLKKENIEPKSFICTLRLVRYLDAEEKIDRYNLQYLRYFLDIEIEATAHDALGDVLVLQELYKRLSNKMVEEKIKRGLPYEEAKAKTFDETIEISSRPSLIHTFKFGKYKNQKLAEIATIDQNYLRWLYDEKKKEEVADEDWIYTLEYYLKK